MGAWSHSHATSRTDSPNHSAMHSGRNSPRTATGADDAAGTSLGAAAAVSDSAAAPASTSALGTTLVPTGSARISDLDPAEKGKIGSLLREVVSLQRSRAQLEQSQAEMEREMRSLAQRSAISEQEAAELRVQCQRGIDMLAEYQARMHAAEAAEANRDPQAQLPQPVPLQQLPQPPPPSHSDNPNISRLQELSERARAAAYGVPSFAPTYAATPAALPGSRSALSTPALHAASRLPHAQPPAPMMTRYVPSASAAATSPYQPHAAAAAVPVAAAAPVPQIPQRQSRPPSPPPQPYVSAAQQQIDREYVTALIDAKEQLGALSHSLETQRLDREQRTMGSKRSSRDPSPSSASRSVSPPAARAVAVVSAPAASPPCVSILATAVSGVTRTLALSSPESLEKRAIALANQMYERKMAEQAETERRKRQLEEREQAWRIPAAAPTAAAAPSTVHPAPTQPDSKAPSKPAGISLSSFFHSHPLTSALSPLTKQRTQTSRSQHQQWDEHKEESKPPPPQPSSQPSTSAATASAPTDSESDFVSNMLSKSMRLAQTYAEERERRAQSTAVATAAPAAATSASASSRNFTRPSETKLSAAPFDSAAAASFSASSSIPRSAAAASSSRTLSQDPSSPYSTVLPSSQLALLTPTSRKIHRLISIQNPLHPQLRAAAEVADREEREFAAKEASKLQEMALKLEERRREVAKAEAMVQAKRERERAAADAAPHSQAAILSAADRAKQPASRAKTPVETYVPPPFSFRPSSRAASAQQKAFTAGHSVQATPHDASAPQSEDETQEKDEDRFNDSRSSTHFDAVRTPAGGMIPSRSAHTTPGTALSTPSSIGSMHQHAVGHTSFISPAPSSRPSTHARKHLRSDAAVGSSDDAHAEADAEVWDVFHLRSPSQLQTKDAPTASAPVASRSVSVATTPSLAQRQEAAARNFGLSMQNQQRAALQTSMEHYQAVADASHTFSPAAVQQALTTPAPPRAPLALSSAAPLASAPPAPSATAVASWRMPAASPSRMQVRLESLHMAQLERELEELVPHVLEELAMQRERAETPQETAPAAKVQSYEDEQRDKRIARMTREVEARPRSRAAAPAEPDAYPSVRDVHSRLSKQQQAMEEESKLNTQQAQRALQHAQEARARSIGTSYSPARVAGTALRARPNDFDASLLDVIDQMGDE